MAKGVNFCFHGRLGKDPALKYVGANNTPLVNFSVCINMGEKQDAEWMDCTAWGENALDIAEKFSKGDIIYIKQSSPKTDKWTDNNGQKRTKLNWIVWEYHAKDEDSGSQQQGGGMDDGDIPY